jgi:phospholipid/cholesterol/gamma-HCH transport system substrate-binding protein
MSISASQRARLGVFMTVGILLAALFIAIPIGFRLANRQMAFYAYFAGESVSGLEQGADVKFRGVPVGKVIKIAYDRNRLERVRVDVRIERDFPLKTDMYGQISGISITGIKHIELSGGTDEAGLLPEGSEIPTRQSPMTIVTGKAEEIIAKIEVLLNHLNGLTHPDSAVGVVLDNVAAITTDVRGIVSDFRPQMERGASSAIDLIARIDSMTADLSVIVAETRRTFSGERFTSIMASVDSSAMSIKHVSDDISLIVRQSREDIMVSMENLRDALENANELTKILAENPSLLLRGEQQKERDPR